MTEAVDQIEGLQVVVTKKCDHCFLLFASAKGIQKHICAPQKKEPGISIAAYNAKPSITAQRISKQNGSKFFPVKSQCESRDQSCDKIGIASRLLTFDDAGVPFADDIIPIDDRMHAPFVKCVNPAEKLRDIGVDMAVSVQLAGGVSEEYGNLGAAQRKNILDLLLLYYEKARSVYRGDAQFGNLSLDVMTPGATKKNKHFNFLSKSEGSKGTLENYARYTTAMVLMACRVVFYEEKNFRKYHSIHPWHKEFEI